MTESLEAFVDETLTVVHDDLCPALERCEAFGVAVFVRRDDSVICIVRSPEMIGITPEGGVASWDLLARFAVVHQAQALAIAIPLRTRSSDGQEADQMCVIAGERGGPVTATMLPCWRDRDGTFMVADPDDERTELKRAEPTGAIPALIQRSLRMVSLCRN